MTFSSLLAISHLRVGDDVRERGRRKWTLPGVVEKLGKDCHLLQLYAVLRRFSLVAKLTLMQTVMFNYLLLARVHVLHLREGVRADGPVEEVLEPLPQHVRDRRAALAELLQRRDHVEHEPRAAHLDVAFLQRGHLSQALR